VGSFTRPPEQSPEESRKPSSALGLWAPSATWRICPDAGHCDPNAKRRWNRHPAEVAAQVEDNLGSLPGVPWEAYEPIAQHWRQMPPVFQGRPVTLEDIAIFTRQLLRSDPFGTGPDVPYLDFNSPGGGKTVAITQRQLAFLVANALMGNSIQSGDGLSAALRRCSERANMPRAYLRSLLSLLAVLSRELEDQAHGSTIVAATPVQGSVGAGGWRGRLARPMQEPAVCSEVPGQARTCQLEDFMAGGTRFQALTDIAGTVVGGGGALCEVANTQDESLVHFYSEVLALAFFTGPGLDGASMLPVPMAFLGVRRYMGDIQGETSTGPPFYNTCGRIREANWLNEDVQKAGTLATLVDGVDLTVAASSFIAVASTSSAARGGCSVGQAMDNKCMNQRNHLDEDVSLWFGAFAASQYGFAAQQAFRQVVRRVGTGPWGAGVWFGDSQQYFLAVWLATSLLDGASLDYYIYDHFCENPSNQCFLLGGDACSECISKAQVIGSPVHADRCGQATIWDMIEDFKGKPAQALYDALRTVGGPPEQVFDLLRRGQTGRGPPPDMMGPPAELPRQAPQMPRPPADMPRPAPGQSRSGEENVYRREEGVGTWGGVCTCPDGQRYEVGDNLDNCASLACEFGAPGPCSSSGLQPGKEHMKVTCAPAGAPAPAPGTPARAPGVLTPVVAEEALAEPEPSRKNYYRKSDGVGDWGGICECPDGRLYEVGDNNDFCGSLACEFGKAGHCSDGGILAVNQGMKVTCAPKEGHERRKFLS